MCRDDRDEIDRRDGAGESPRVYGTDREESSAGEADAGKRTRPVVVPLRRRVESGPRGPGPDDDDPGPAAA